MILREPPSRLSNLEFASKLKNDKRDSHLVGEIVGTTISCSAAVLSWIVIIGSSVAIPISGGTSSAVTYLAFGAATASTIQCGNGLLRTGLEVHEPELKDWLDSQDWYTNASLAVDAISLADAGASGVVLAKTLKIAKTASSKSTPEILKGLSRAERKRLTQEIIKLNHPGISAKVMKSLISAGKYPKRYSQQQISQALSLRVKEALAASLSFFGSATSGVTRQIAVGVYDKTIE